VSIVGLIVLMFAAGISTVGITHQAGWLLTSPHALVVSRADLGWKSGSTLTQLALGFHNYESAYGALPSNVGDPPLHSWQAKMLPFVGQRVDAIDFSRSWDDPRNTAAMRGVVSVYLNPRVGVIRDARGYALSHHVGNVHVFGVGGPQTFDDVPGGLSQTMMAGEVASGFKPWGDPSNLRDPLLPFDGSPRAFGSPEGGGANVLMMDGSVKFVSDHADPKVLRVLSGVRD
jgi:prepilin-type processing-associated H-X9-DG protein